VAILNQQHSHQYYRRPSAIVFMARAMLSSANLSGDGSFPKIALRWTGLRIERGSFARFCHATGLDPCGEIPILFPHVFGFPLQMALLTHSAFPLPIWNALQIRNHLIRHREINTGTALELETRVGANRRVAKGIEVDLLSKLSDASGCCWESVVTYFYRGKYGVAAVASSSPEDAAPDLSGASLHEKFRLPQRGGWGFGRLTGDYNGIHNWNWYARRMGFRGAFLHPQRAAGLSMARLQGPTSPEQTLRLWIKGPLFYGAHVVLRSAELDDGIRFGLALEGDDRIALAGLWRTA
jgi:hypothetical protein